MEITLKGIQNDFREKKIRRDLLQENLEKEQGNVRYLTDRLDYAGKARAFIQQVAQETQQNLEYHISSLVTTALASVFPDPPEFVAQVVQRRNKTEWDLLFKEFGVLEKPVDASGGGPLDVASNALRYTYWSLNPNRATFILDEPFKFVSPNLQHKVSDMLKMLSKELGIQIIMVSHADEINYSADKTFLVEKIGKKSKVSVV
jgi:ABC-type dipeptide/oligopeptide/nickel transport system ATPase subunit